MWPIVKWLGGAIGKLVGPAASKVAGRSRLWVFGSLVGLFLSLPPETLTRIANQMFWLGLAYIAGESVKDTAVAVFAWLKAREER